jgi:hypothetical protein
MVAQAHGRDEFTLAWHRQRFNRKPWNLAHLPRDAAQ